MAEDPETGTSEAERETLLQMQAILYSTEARFSVFVFLRRFFLCCSFSSEGMAKVVLQAET